MARNSWRAALLILGFGAARAAVFAQGGPPLVTDDPGTVEPGHWEINTAWTREHRSDGTATELPLVDINYGWNERTQLKYEVSWLRLSGDGSSARGGVSDSLIGVKWRFVDEASQGVAVATYPQFGFRTAGTSVRRGISSGGNTLLLPLELQKTFGQTVGVNADFGYVGSRRDGDMWFGGLAVGREFGERCELLAELHAERDVGAPGLRVLANLGARLKLAKAATLLLSLGREVHNRGESAATVSYLGIQWSR